jgi:hypothetical protein
MNMQRIAFVTAVVLVSLSLLAWPVAAQTTLSGDIEINQTVSDGEQLEYEVADGATVSDASLSLTGVNNTEEESYQWSGTGTKSITVGGTSVTTAVVNASAPATSNTDTGQDTGSGPPTGDLDGDGTDEIVYLDSSDNLKYYDVGDSTSTDTGDESYGSSTGDVDGDGADEIVYFDTSENLKYYDVGDKTSTDTGKQTPTTPSAGDIDGDGTDEIVYQDTSNDLDYYDVADGTNTHTGEGATKPSTGDIDGDGTDEIVYEDRSGNQNLDYYDVADGTSTDTGQDTSATSAGDVDGDGTDEIVYLSSGDNSIEYYDVADGTNTDTGQDTSTAVSTGDIDDDGTDEIAYSDSSDNLNYYDAEDGTNTETTQASDNYYRTYTGEVDGDGVDEIVYRDTSGNLDYYGVGSPAKVEFDVGDDGTADAIIDVPGGGSKSASLSGLTTSTDTLAISANESITTAELSYTEVTETQDPGVEVNSSDGSQTINHTGTLSDGSTVDLSGSIDESRIGGNVTVNVSVSESVTDGPPGRVELDYSHSAEFSDADQLGQFATLDDQYKPSINDPTPAGGGVLNNDTADVSALVSGGSLPIGGAVNVTISAGGNTDLDSTIASEQRVGTQLSTVVGGANDWTVTVEDAQTGDTVSKTYSFNAPAQLELRDESQPTQLISDDNISFTARFFGTESGDVFSRDVVNGTADMTGLPVDQPLIVEVSGNNSEYVSRRVLIESILQQQSVYLLPTSVPSAEVRFNINDQTGRFGDETTFFVEKPITRNNETEFRVISGDKLGPTRSFESVLEDGERYRLRLVSPSGETRVLGDYRVSGAAVETLPIGQVEFSADINEGAAMQASIRPAADGASHDHEARVVYVDPGGATSKIKVSVVNSDGTAIRPTATEQLDGSDDIFVATYPLNTSFDPEQDSANVTVTATRNGETETFKQRIGDVPPIDFAPLPPDVLELMGFVSILAIIGLLVIVKPSMAALVGSGYAGLLTLVGVVPIPMPAVVLAGLVSVLVTVGTSGRLR